MLASFILLAVDQVDVVDIVNRVDGVDKVNSPTLAGSTCLAILNFSFQHHYA